MQDISFQFQVCLPLLTDEDLKAEDIIYKDSSLKFDMIVADEKLNNIDLVLNNYIMYTSFIKMVSL